MNQTPHKNDTAQANGSLEATDGGCDPISDNSPHALLVDDDNRIRDLLSQYMQRNGWRVTAAHNVAAARASMRGLQFDVIILDIMMPGESGLDFARELKSTSDVPICMLTAQADVDSRVTGLETGVDDYVPKPFEPRELLLRIQNIMRRTEALPEMPSDEIRLGNLTFHISRAELRNADKSIRLTERERELLRLFAQRPGVSIARHELANEETGSNERAIDVQINRLRRKIEADPANPVYLQTVRGKGYILYVD